MISHNHQHVLPSTTGDSISLSTVTGEDRLTIQPLLPHPLEKTEYLDIAHEGKELDDHQLTKTRSQHSKTTG